MREKERTTFSRFFPDNEASTERPFITGRKEKAIYEYYCVRLGLARVCLRLITALINRSSLPYPVVAVAISWHQQSHWSLWNILRHLHPLPRPLPPFKSFLFFFIASWDWHEVSAMSTVLVYIFILSSGVGGYFQVSGTQPHFSFVLVTSSYYICVFHHNADRWQIYRRTNR